MKKTLTLLILSSMLVLSCKDDDNTSILDPLTPIMINGQTQTKSTDSLVMHVITKSWELNFKGMGGTLRASLGAKDDYLYENGMTRDEKNRRILFVGNNVIQVLPNGTTKLGMLITEAEDVLFTSIVDSVGKTLDPKTSTSYELLNQLVREGGKRDTIGYIPNAVLKSAQERIIAAYNAENYETCYTLFDSVMTFVPTTSAEYRRLKKEGIE